ncbi:MAG: DNA mismatch repair endonuclease MutL [Cyclobacteriaceae bacterium]|nr:DNA mismatch repair endonuclease MutL [Cyclobacteriaceae bacterium]MCH8515656.1 DNA mismatch repair endonuclease MutL [Cyclobacteriaceae bacterium]
MSDIIKLLPDSLANQIAAGEVVQRPASVVKELLENSVDAGATEISLIVKEAGKTLIQVTDNGKGMSPNDARMSFERHATSKISRTEDLFNILTKGFRGEALASIAAVAQVEMTTKASDQELGLQLIVEGSQFKSAEPIASLQGTTIKVKNLFFNVPARRNFLKSHAVEMRHISEEFQRVALAHPDIEFHLYHNEVNNYKLTSGKLSKRIVDLFGKNYREQLISCKEETDYFTVTGYIGRPESAKKTRGEQYLFVNQRFIKSPYLHHAILKAYSGLIAEGHHPFYVLYLTIDPKHIDINVHPTKTEIKFDDEKVIYSIMLAAIKQALGQHNIMPSLDFEHGSAPTVNFERFLEENERDEPKTVTRASSFNADTNFRSSTENWQELFEGFGKKPSPSDTQEASLRSFSKGFAWDEDSSQPTEDRSEQSEPQVRTFGSSINSGVEIGDQAEKKNFIQLESGFIATPLKSGLMLVHCKYAQQRILFEKYLKKMESGKGSCQQLLFPESITTNPADAELITEMTPELNAMGFRFEILNSNELVLSGVPPELENANERETFEGLIEQYKYSSGDLDVPMIEKIAQAIAIRSTAKFQKKMNGEEMQAIVDQLFACKNPNFSPQGKPTFKVLATDKITELFG